jgi:hypothetical protein
VSARTRAAAAMAVLGVLAAAPVVAAPALSTEKDLTAVIALQGQPCGQVVSATRRGENDYTVRCQDGNRYRVFVDARGRVVVQKQ